MPRGTVLEVMAEPGDKRLLSTEGQGCSTRSDHRAELGDKRGTVLEVIAEPGDTKTALYRMPWAQYSK